MQLNRFAIGLACVVSAAFAQGTDWPTYGGDLASSKYRPLDQINAVRSECRCNSTDSRSAWPASSQPPSRKAPTGPLTAATSPVASTVPSTRSTPSDRSVDATQQIRDRLGLRRLSRLRARHRLAHLRRRPRQ